ncbi:MAG: hydrogenase maturation protease [Armatimonadota bacterium]
MPKLARMCAADELMVSLRSILSGKVVVVGIGDACRGDDGVGPLTVRLLAESGMENLIDAGVSPELETWRIREAAPDAVLFVDAVDFGGSPGDVAILEPGDLRAEGFDTHRAPLRLTMEYLEAELGARCRLLAVQPRDVRQGAAMCPEVRQSVQHLAAMIARIRQSGSTRMVSLQ